MTDYQQQHEAEMYEAAQNVAAPREYAYSVIVTDTGARCLSTNDLGEARARATAVAGFVIDQAGRRVHPAHGKIDRGRPGNP